jgi:hypothetical protein
LFDGSCGCVGAFHSGLMGIWICSERKEERTIE